jgi:hypothetical protein
MLKPLTSAAVGLFGCVLLFAGCGNRREAEAQFLGTWSRASMDSTTDLTFNSDHTFIQSGESLGEYTVFGSGKWYLDYKKIFIRFDHRDEGALVILYIADVTPEELKITHKDWVETYKRVKTLTREEVQRMAGKRVEYTTTP